MEIREQLIRKNPYSRPGTKITPTKVIVHYVGNPGSTAQNNRDYFDNLAKTHATYVSAHYVVGLQGEVIQCIPEDEISYGASEGNQYGINIETCHPDKTGKFSAVTEQALAELVADICVRRGFDPAKDVIRHYDVTGKKCPLWYVERPEAWLTFREKVKALASPPKPDKLYRVQVGAFASRENAERQMEELKNKGYSPIIKEE